MPEGPVRDLPRTAMGIIDLRVLDLQAEHMPVAAQIGEAECIPLVVGYHAECALGGNARTGRDPRCGPAARAIYL